jgi:integrase
VLLKFAFEASLIQTPVRFGEFKRPSKSAMRRQRELSGARLIEAPQLQQLLGIADCQLQAMILLGVNCGFGNADCGMLPLAAVDLTGGWIEFPRPKTGIKRRCPLWPETIAAVNEWLERRKGPRDPALADLMFATKYGQPWHVDGRNDNPLSAAFRKLLNRIDAAAEEEARKDAEENGTKYKAPCKVYRPGVGFYSLRHTFQTVADECGDYIATRRIMGHADHSISDNYRERFPDDRLRRVADHVHAWLYKGQLTPAPGE